MKLIKACNKHFDIVKRIVQNTIETIYPKYYPEEAVDFFLSYHSDDTINKAIINATVYIIQDNGELFSAAIVKNQ